MSATLRGSRDQLALSGDAAATGIHRASRLRRFGGLLYRIGLPVLGLTSTLVIWQAVTSLFEIDTFFLPTPGMVGEWLAQNVSLWVDQGRITVLETLAGFGLGTSAGLLVALALVASPALVRALLPLVIALNSVPKVALAPLFVVWFGIQGYSSHIALAASICFFPIMIATMAGLMSTPAELGELARSLSASRWKAFIKVRVPWALPQVFVGLKLGMTLAVIGAVVAEQIRPNGGLGTVIFLAGQNARTTTIFGAVVVLMAISLILFYAVVLAERLLLPWARETSAARL
jgi:NitT/TauT family transport system permease protein